MIAVESAALRAGALRIADLSFTVPSGGYGVLMGATGSGKTSLLEAICGLRRLDGGRVLVGGRDVTRARPGDRGIGFVPQDGALFPTMTVREHLAFALRIRRRSEREIAQRVGELAERLELGALLERRPIGLSGGERQRVALGRALSFGPAALCLDEPLSALDESAQERMRTLLAEIHRGSGVTVLHITHSRAEARALGTVRLRLDNGAVTEDA
jgi:ABC-type sugar transport system ATPase subunit